MRVVSFGVLACDLVGDNLGVPGMQHAFHRRLNDQQLPALDDPHVSPALMFDLALGLLRLGI
jgi:hypothetical protein